MKSITSCLTNIIAFLGIIILILYFIIDQFITGIFQFDTIGNFDFKLYKRNIFNLDTARPYRVSLSNYNVYDSKYKLTNIKSKKIQGNIEYNQVLIYRGIMDIQYTRYWAISYFYNGNIKHGYIITPKDIPPKMRNFLRYDDSIKSGEYVKYFYEASYKLYDTFKKDIHNLYTVSINDLQSQTLIDKGYEEFEYIKDAVVILNEIVDYNQPNCVFNKNCDRMRNNDFYIESESNKVFCDKISCEKIKTIFEYTFSDDNLKKYYLTLKIPQI